MDISKSGKSQEGGGYDILADIYIHIRKISAR